MKGFIRTFAAFGVLAMISFIFAPSSVSAQTQSEINQDLRAQLSILTEEVGRLVGQINERTGYESTCVDLALFRNLSFGSSGQDVSNLQSYLRARGYLSAAPTGFYGSDTARAVELFKAHNGINWLWTAGTIKSHGVVDGTTRALLRKMCQ